MEYRIWAFWMGGEFTENRKACLESIQKNSECEVTLVHESELSRYLKHKNDLHPAFKYLSPIHKGAVLRSYFMYHYGGGYSDIKRCNFSWRPFFDKLAASSCDFIGYGERSREGVVGAEEVKDSWTKLVGNGMFIFKKQTDFAKEWLNRTNEMLEIKFHDLKRNPGWYHSRALTGGIEGMEADQFINFKHSYKTFRYPIAWGEPMGKIFQQMQYENEGRYINGMPYIDTRSYL